jgi:16S rRNA (adenine1518-N6/adenine1519-N6)-dimethyltransferase
VRRLFDIQPSAFTPPPKVVSTVVELVPRDEPLAPADPAALERVTAAAFNQRRKMLRSSLKALGVDSEALLARAGIVATRRAEELSVEEFCALGARLHCPSRKPLTKPASPIWRSRLARSAARIDSTRATLS